MRVSVTSVEQYRLVCTTEWASEAELVASLTGKAVESWQMRAGSAFHKLLEVEELSVADDGLVRVGEWLFKHADVVQARSSLPPGGVHECKIELPRMVDGERITLVAKADLLVGNALHEHKCKFGSFDVKFYERSLQWAFYLMAFEAAWIDYRFFQFGEPDKNGILHLRDLSYCRFFPYPGMAEECQEWLAAFVVWARSRGLLHPQPRAA